MLEAGVGAVRVLRALVFLAIATSLTIAGHVIGGGSVSTAAVVALALVTWPVALLGSRRQRGVRHLFPVLVAVQLAGHAVIAFFSTAASGTSAATCATHLAHHGHVVLECGEPAAAASMTAHGSTPAMTAAHLGAALMLSVVLARGEAVLWRVVDLVMPDLPRLRPLDIDVRRAVVLVRRWQPRRHLVLVSGRGPPVPA
jgi:hypothetical protein